MSKPVSFVMSEEVKKLLEELAKQQGRSMSKCIEHLIKEAAKKELHGN